MSNAITVNARTEWRRGWGVVLAAASGMALASIPTQSFGVLIGAMERELGWSRAQITTGPAIVSIIGMTLSIVVGAAIDRIGARRIGVAAVFTLCGALALMMTLGQSLVSWWLLWALIGLGCATMPTVWVVPINRLFNSGRGLATALTLSGSSIAAALVPITATLLVERYGWRGAYFGLALLFGLFTLPLVLFLFRNFDARPVPADSVEAVAMPVEKSGLSVRQGLRSLSFYVLAIAGFGTTFGGVALLMNLVPIFIDSGIDSRTAAAITGIIGISTILGRLAGGFLMDRMSVSVIGTTVTLATITLPLAVLLAPGSVMAAGIGVAIYGLTSGVKITAIIYLAGRHFGTRAFGTLFGAIQALTALGVGLGPLLANMAYDALHSYRPVLIAVIPVFLLVACCFMVLGRYPDFEE